MAKNKAKIQRKIFKDCLFHNVVHRKMVSNHPNKAENVLLNFNMTQDFENVTSYASSSAPTNMMCVFPDIYISLGLTEEVLNLVMF